MSFKYKVKAGATALFQDFFSLPSFQVQSGSPDGVH